MFEFFEVGYKDIVDIPSLKIRQGVTAIIGASGSGKTTFLRMLNKMISPTRGRILYKGADMKQIESVKLRRKVMMLSQAPVIFQGSVRDNLLMAFTFQDRKPPDDEELEKVISKIQLNKILDTPAEQLSGGEKQRLALGRLLLMDPEVYLLDEPSSALDSDTEDMMISMITEKVRVEEKSVIIVTHSRAVAEKYADDIIEMLEGKIVNRGSGHGKHNRS